MFAYTARSNIADPPTDLERRCRSSATPTEPLREELRAQRGHPHARARERARVEQGGQAVRAGAGGPRRPALRAHPGGARSGSRAPAIPARAADDLGHPHPLLDRADLARRLSRLRAAGRRRLRPARLRSDRRGDRRGDPRGGAAPGARAARRRLDRRSPTPRATASSTPSGCNPEAPADEAAARAASIDSKLWVVRVDARDGDPIGVWSNFAIHPTSFGDENLLFSGDNAASAERIARGGDRRGGRRCGAGRLARRSW